jgi:hypothetical protein
MDNASRLLTRSAAKILAEVQNHGTLTTEEMARVHAAYRRLMIALKLDRKAREVA